MLGHATIFAYSHNCPTAPGILGFTCSTIAIGPHAPNQGTLWW